MQKVRDALIDWYTDQSGERGREALIKSVMRQYGNISHEGAVEEIVNEALAKLFSTDNGVEDFMSWLRNESGYNEAERKTIIQRIIDMLKRIIDTIKQVITNGELSYVAEEFAGMQADKAHEIRQQFLKVLDGAAENYKNQTQSVKTGAIKDSRKLTGNANKMYNKDGFKMSGREIAMLDSAVIKKNANNGKLNNIIGVYSNNFYYVVSNSDWGVYTVKQRLNPEVDYKKIEILERAFKNGKYNSKNGNISGSVESVLRLRSDRQGRIDMHFADAENGAAGAENDRLHSKSQKGNEFGTVGKSNGDFKGGVKYSLKPTNSSGLSTDNRAKTPYDSVNKWVYDAEIFSYEENKLFHQKISEINQGSNAFEKNVDGEYMLPIENKIVFTDGDYNSPYITRIIEVMSDYATDFEDIRRRIYDAERNKSSHKESALLIKDIYGERSVYEYASNVDGAYEWVTGRRKRKSRKSIVKNYRTQQDGGRNASSSSEIVRNGNDDTIYDEEGLKYSLKHSLGITDLEKQNKSLLQQNKEYEAIIRDLKRQLKNPDMHHFVDFNKIKAVARKFKSEYASTMNVTELSDALGELYNLIANSKNLNWDIVSTHAEDIAEKILKASKHMQPEISDYSKEILKDIRSVGVKLSDEQKQEVASRFGSYGEFYKKCFGTITIRNNGISLDTRWQELCESYPGIFDKNASEADQAVLLFDAVQALRNTYKIDFACHI